MYNDGTKKTVSYPKYLVEISQDRYLNDDETVDHIDSNFLNNDLSNLRVLSRKQHCENDVYRNKPTVVKCQWCNKEFTIDKNISHRNIRNSGYFCSRRCVGLYGKAIQENITYKSYVESIQPEKFRLRD